MRPSAGIHYKNVCREHGIIVEQCRCAGPKIERLVEHDYRCDMVQALRKAADKAGTDS